MKKLNSIKLASASLTALVLLGTAAMNARAAAPTLQGQLVLRPVTPGDIKAYGLTNPPVQGASGLSSIGVGQPAYLEVLDSVSFPATNIISVTFSLTNQPINSHATLSASPLGANVPTAKMADRFNQAGAPVFQVIGLTMLRPDVAGQYTVLATVITGTAGTTNFVQNISAATYMGAHVCANCHSGGPQAPDVYPIWAQTPHASFLTRAIDGLESDHYSKNCISCHTVGYDTNTNAVNGGFDDIAKSLNWTFPSVLTNGNWAKMPLALQRLGNIQCENCHGPGSEHAQAFGDTNLFNWPRIDKTFAAGDCGQCHDSPNTHIKNAEWNNSIHARTTRTPSGSGSRIACVRCHTGPGFADYVENLGSTNAYVTNTVYEAITCQACHDPHDASNPYQLRTGTTVPLADGTVVTNAGSGGFCFNCHTSRNGSYTNSIENYQQGKQTWNGGTGFGVHDSPQADMLEGVNAFTYGKTIPSSAHRSSITNTCAGCHMQTVAMTDPAFLQAGGHTFHMTYNTYMTNGSTIVTNTLDKVTVCVQCHGKIDSFDMVRADYNGDGVTEGVQTEVQNLLNKLSTMLPNSTYVTNGNYVADGLVKSPSSKTNWPSKFLKASYNWQFVNNDGSKGVHNVAYAVGLLKASIADLTGDSNNDGLPDAWQIQYFGSAASASAAPNYSAAGDGVPNWMKYLLGLDPTKKGLVVPGGVVYANGPYILNPPDPSNTNAIKIFTAAEVAFATEVGKTYQLQAASSITGGWQPVGSPITGTGETMSFVTPTRAKVQQYFRVLSQ